jgi:hypothetical protein
MHILTYLSKNMIVSIYEFIHTLSSATILAKGKQCRCWRTEEETAICLGKKLNLDKKLNLRKRIQLMQET